MNSKAIVIFCAALASLSLSAAESATFDEAVRLHDAQNYSEARKMFEALDASGDIRATYALGFVYRRGVGTPIEPTKAAEYLQRAADAGHTGAKNDLGIMLRDGHGMNPDRRRAYELFEESASEGNPYGMINSARFPLDADTTFFTEEILRKSLARAEGAKAQGKTSLEALIGTLQCAVNADAQPSPDTLVRESIRQHELTGSVRAVENRFSGDTHYFSKGGYLLRTVFRSSRTEQRFTYSSDCKLQRWEALRIEGDGSGRSTLMNYEDFHYAGSRLARVSRPKRGSLENIRRYEYFPQSDGGVVVKSALDGPYPTSTYIKYDSNRLVIWANGGVPVFPTANLEIVPGSGIGHSRLLNEGSRNMTLQGGELFRRDRKGRITAIIDSNAMDFSTQYVVEYTYGRHGWVTSETRRNLSGRDTPIRSATYNSYELDSRGNWTSRTKSYNPLGQEMVTGQSREIYYY